MWEFYIPVHYDVKTVIGIWSGGNSNIELMIKESLYAIIIGDGCILQHICNPVNGAASELRI